MRGAVLVLAVCAAAGAAADPAGWPQYGGPGRDFVTADRVGGGKDDRELWRRDLGTGTSGVAAADGRLFTQYAKPNPKMTGEGEEFVVGLDAKTGQTLWEKADPVARRKGQESFSGDPIRPQATPAVAGGRVCALGYTGLLTCLDAADGKVLWRHDLVKDFDATPVQFGFAASPLALGDRFVVHVGGKRAAVVAFDAATGKPAWQSKPGEPSYASPVLVPGGDGGDTVVQVTRDAVVGLSAKDGGERWAYPLPKPGLTNVPTPLVLPKGRLLVSGQGFLGTRLLEVSGTAVKEVWANDKVRFFYSNWVTDGETVYGAAGDVFVAVRLSDGRELWRERGQKDANVLRTATAVLAVRGDGQLTRCRPTADGPDEADGGYKLLKGRCWAPPTVAGGVLYARSDAEVVAVRLSAAEKK